MNFISKLIARPKSLVASSDDMEQSSVVVTPPPLSPLVTATTTSSAPATPSPTSSFTTQETNIIEELLVQINDNLTNQGNVPLSSSIQKQFGAKIPPNKVGLNRSSENIYNKSDDIIGDFTGSNETLLDSNSIDLPVTILKPSKSSAPSVTSLDDSLVSSINTHLDSLSTRETATPDQFSRSKSLSVPLESESSGSHVSSDNETFVECRSFSPSEESNRFTSALDLISIADSSSHGGWEDLVTSVSEMDIDNLDTTHEQLDNQFDMTPTDSSSNLVALNLTEVKTIEPSIIITSHELPEAVANLIENVDTNSCDNDSSPGDLVKCQEHQIVPTTIDDLSCSKRSPSSDFDRTIEGYDSEYFKNVTLEALESLAAGSSSDKTVNLLDTTNEPIDNPSIERSWAKEEQEIEKLPTSRNETDLNVTQNIDAENECDEKTPNLTHEEQDLCLSPEPMDVDCDEALSLTATQFEMEVPSELVVENNKCEISADKTENDESHTLDQRSPSPPLQQIENAVDEENPNKVLKLDTSPSQPILNNSQFPVKTARNQSSFPQCSPDEKPLATPSFNTTIDIANTSPKGTQTTSDLRVLNETVNITDSPLQNKTPPITVFDQTFNGVDSNPVNNETVVVDNEPNVANETVTYESIGVDSCSLSEKEKNDTLNEKDVFVKNISSSSFRRESDDGNMMFKVPKSSGGFSGLKDAQPDDLAADEDFQSNRIFLNPSDFDFLLTKGSSDNGVEVDRSSLLLRFDPLLGHSVPVNIPVVKAGSSTLSKSSEAAASSSSPNDRKHQHQLQQEFNIQNRLSPANEEDEHFYDSNRSFCLENGLTRAKPEVEEHQQPPVVEERRHQPKQQKPIQITARSIKKNVKMSVDVMQDMKIENDTKSIEEIDTQTDIKQNFKMDELEKKIKNEVLKTEDIEKKLKEAEQREEALIKRITEKDKSIAKMNGVIEAYEKAIAELISEKEHLLQNYEKQLTEVKADRDSNYHHLTSLETTFSDLHVKYEKSKEMTAQLKNSEETLLAEKRQNLENLRLQEQRYEKMKNHAMQQLEIANKKLESLTKNHSMEITKLKALLKKEEISRASMTEQLQQKTRENEELVKICDELINGQGS